MRYGNSKSQSFFITALLYANLWGCQSGRLYIETEPPEAEVTQIKDGINEHIGNTPIETPLIAPSDNNYIEYQISQSNHQTYKILIPGSHLHLNHRLKLKLTRLSKDENSLKAYSLDEIAELLKTIKNTNAAIQAKNTPKAEQLLSVLRENFSSLSTIQTLEAKLALVKGENEKAITHFQNAIQLAPDDVSLLEEFKIQFPDSPKKESP